MTAGTSERVDVQNSRMLKTLRREATDATPVWFMRQAGRSLPEYRAIREKYNLVEICRQPELCAEVTLQPVRRLGVDAAVMFADIMLPLIGIGVDLELVETIGPVIAHPLRTLQDVERLRPLEPEQDVPYVLESIRCTLRELKGSIPLIGFSGAPFTLAAYLIEGRPSRDFLETKRFMYTKPDLWRELMRRLTRLISTYLSAQIEAGVQVVQLFDSWVGALSVADYRRYVKPYSAQILQLVTAHDLPVLHFGTGTAALLEDMRDAGGSGIGIDWRVPLDAAWARIGYDRAIQGNLDPLVLLGPWDVVRRETQTVLDAAGGRAGHVFNLGHGVHLDTSPDQLHRLVDFVHSASAA